MRQPDGSGGGKDLPEDYFYRGVWAPKGTPPRLRSHTCVVCGLRSATWEGFLSHREGCRRSRGSVKLEGDVRVYDPTAGDAADG